MACSRLASSVVDFEIEWGLDELVADSFGKLTLLSWCTLLNLV
jgi:hypothetical protein